MIRLFIREYGFRAFYVVVAFCMLIWLTPFFLIGFVRTLWTWIFFDHVETAYSSAWDQWQESLSEYIEVMVDFFRGLQ